MQSTPIYCRFLLNYYFLSSVDNIPTDFCVCANVFVWPYTLTYMFYVYQELTERMEALLLEKAECQQRLVLSCKDLERTKKQTKVRRNPNIEADSLQENNARIFFRMSL